MAVRDRALQLTLLVYIDDATSEPMHLKAVESENGISNMLSTMAYRAAQ